MSQKILVLIFIGLISSSCNRKLTGNYSYSKLLESGIASWYGPGFQGKKTANGEVFDTNGFTAAHRTLPFGTRLRVLNTENGKAVNVRINDRGPYAKDRIIDLSKAAANKLEMIRQGTARVKLFLLANSPSIDVENLKTPTYTVQIASFQEKQKATQLSAKYSDGWVKEVRANGKLVFRVFVGKYNSSEKARKRLSQLKDIKGFVKQIENY